MKDSEIKQGQVPFVLQFAEELPTVGMAGVTMYNSGGTTGGGPSSEDANMDTD